MQETTLGVVLGGQFGLLARLEQLALADRAVQKPLRRLAARLTPALAALGTVSLTS